MEDLEADLEQSEAQEAISRIGSAAATRPELKKAIGLEAVGLKAWLENDWKKENPSKPHWKVQCGLLPAVRGKGDGEVFGWVRPDRKAIFEEP